MGVEPLTPGADVIQIKPQLGKLSFAKLKTTTINGEVLVSYNKAKESDRMEVSIPGVQWPIFTLHLMLQNLLYL